MKIAKFGGTSVGTADSLRRVRDIVLADAALGIVVVSALSGVTDQLGQMGHAAARQDAAYPLMRETLENRHYELTRDLFDVRVQGRVLAQLKRLCNELEDLLHGISLLRECSPRVQDLLLSFGEQLSATLIAAFLTEAGRPALYTDARRLIRTDDHFGAARVDFATTEALTRAYVADQTALPVVTGFVAATARGETTTLGRGGSDYTAAILAAVLGAEEIEIWTDVDGVMTADPRRVPGAFSLPTLSYAEAMEMSHFGAKVIYPPTLQPAFSRQIPLRIRNTFRPEFAGTLVSEATDTARPVKGISSIAHVALLTLQGSGLVGVPGVASRLFGALARENINVVLITQASSEHSICFAVAPQEVGPARVAVAQEFAPEQAAGQIEELNIEPDLSIVAIIGEGMRRMPGISGRLFGTLGQNGINVVATAQGASERNVSVVIGSADLPKALNALHEAFFLSDQKTLHLYLVGTGLVGGTWLRQLAQQADFLRRERGLHLRVRQVTNRRRMWAEQDTPWPTDWQTALSEAGEAADLTTFLDRMRADNLPHSVLIDCTSGTDVIPAYEGALRAGVAVVTPNKLANTGPYDQYAALRRARGRFCYETNVGAGLPVLSTLQDLLASGDRLLRVEGVLSGTLSYLFNHFTGEKPFSELVRMAQAAGLTEPDPRDDLNGKDVARKVLILAREAGHRLELDDVQVESLLTEATQETPHVTDFFAKLADQDAHFEQQRAEAAARGERLRHAATLADGRAAVGLRAFGAEHPFYALSGSDNMIVFTTERYHERPLVIRGPGAGAEVTAAGVLAEVIGLSRYIG